MRDVVYDLCLLGCRTGAIIGIRVEYGCSDCCLRISLLVSIASCLLGDDILHAK